MKMIHWNLDQEMSPKRGVTLFTILLCYVLAYDGCLCMFMLQIDNIKI
jgi:hypothetical protein